MTHPPSVDKAASDAWDRECARPGAHFWERVVGAVYAAHYRDQIARYESAVQDQCVAHERAIQSRIHAAVLEERNAQGDATIRLAHVKQFCEAWLSADRLEDGTISDAEQKTLQGVWRVAGFDRTFSGAINSEIATDGATGRDDPPSGTTPSPGMGGDKDPASSDRDAIFALIERLFPETGALMNRIIRIHLAHPDIGDVP